MKVLLSLNPKYWDEITAHRKKYEFRKRVWSNIDIKEVIVYSTTPVKKIVGSFTIGQIHKGHPKDLWKRFNEVAGIDEAGFFTYFLNSNIGFAIEISSFKECKPADPKRFIPEFRAPESFRYIDNNIELLRYLNLKE